jgi:hypothetical protein
MSRFFQPFKFDHQPSTFIHLLPFVNRRSRKSTDGGWETNSIGGMRRGGSVVGRSPIPSTNPHIGG